LEAEFGLSQAAAYRFIQAANNFGNFPPVGSLDIAPKALYILAQNSTPEEVLQDGARFPPSRN